MPQLVGYRKTTLEFKDGTTVPGYYLHFSEKMDGVEGASVFNGFVSEKKLGAYVPKLGDAVLVGWSRFKASKIDSVVKA